MDHTTEHIATFATSLTYDDLPQRTVAAAKRLLIDTLGCAIGGYHSEPVKISRRLASHMSGDPPARIFVSGQITSLEAATFANTIMVRYLDYNDVYMSLEAAHPSDMIPAILAIAEAYHLSGKQFLVATIAAYEVYAALSDSVSLWDKGWDHGLFIALGTAAGVGKLLGLTVSQMGEALSLAAVPNVPLRQTRSGELSMWKGCATAASNRAAIYAVLLAKEGMTGPRSAFEGRHGIWEQVTGPFVLGPLGKDNQSFGVERIGIKYFPTEGHSQLPIWLLLNMRSKVRAQDVQSIHVTTYHFTYSEIGSEPQKWDPTTRETADHSLPYMMAAALQDGSISVNTFKEDRIRDPALRPLMNRIKIAESEQFTAQYPEKMPCKIEVITNSGEHFVAHGDYPKGHARNPMSDDEVVKKFMNLCCDSFPAHHCQKVADTVNNLEAIEYVGTLVDAMCVEK